MKLIERIEIKYFRSFGEKSVKIIDLKDLNIFSGSNDVGKSNVLKALNLFFNNVINIDEYFDLRKDLSFLQRTKSQKKVENKRSIRTKEDPYISQRDLFVKVKVFFTREIPYSKSTTPEKFWVERTWGKNGLTKQTSNIIAAYKKKNKKEPTQNQSAGVQGQLTQFLNSIYFQYIPAVKDRKFLQYLFSKLQKSLFDRDNTFKETSEEINNRISGTTTDLFNEFKQKTGVDAQFSVPESLIDFFTTINVSTENGISLYSRGDGIQARFIPAILNEISKGKKNVIWGFEEPENSYEYRNAELLAKDFLNNYSKNKQIFITSHTKEFLSLIRDNEDKVSLHRVYKTLERGSLVETYKKNKGFDKENIQNSFFEGVEEKDITDNLKSTLHKIFEDIGFLENDQYLIDELQNQLKLQRSLLNNTDIKIDEKEKINNHLIKKLKNALLSKEELELQIEEYNKPIIYVEDKLDQIYKISYLKLNNIDCEYSNFESLFKEHCPFTIRRGEGAGKLSGRMRTPNHDGYEDKKVIGIYDFDKEGREQIHNLKREKFWEDGYFGDKKNGIFRKRKDHPCFFAMLLPIPDRIEHLADNEWQHYVSYVEIENLLPKEFLTENKYVEEKNIPGGTYLKVRDDAKSKIWKNLFNLNIESFKDFKPLFDKIIEFVD
ncbi:AAA family ATPase [Tenacibaculum dicentrarchi]|nr:AAA family ATPase [Tenacibaculum dicentrarchi]